jgi:hypothetical protein
VGQVLAFPPASAAPGFERAAAAFVAAHTGGPAWAAGTARKCRETFGALSAKLPGSAADSLAALETEAGRTALARAFDAAFGELALATYARHPVRAALGHHLVARVEVARVGPDCRMGASEDPGGHHPRPDPRSCLCAVPAGRGDPREDAVAPYLRDGGPRGGDACPWTCRTSTCPTSAPA